SMTIERESCPKPLSPQQSALKAPVSYYKKYHEMRQDTGARPSLKQTGRVDFHLFSLHNNRSARVSPFTLARSAAHHLKSCDQVMMNDGPTALPKPAANEILQRWPVSKRVNSSRARDDDSTLMEPINA